MEEIKEIFESLSARIRSPFFGYLFFFTIFFNWKAWFYLLFANTSATGKLAYFDNETTTSSLVYIPLGLAFIATISSPWLRLFFIWAVKFPTTQKNILQARAESEILREKNKLEKNRIESQAIEEDKIISQAERDAQVKALSDKESRESVQQQLDEFRNTLKNTTSVYGQSRKQNVIESVAVTLQKRERNDYRFYVKNGTASMIKDVNLSLSLDEHEQNPFTTDYHSLFPIEKLHVGDEVSVKAIMTLDSPSKFEYTLNWLDANNTPLKKTGILTLGN